MKKNTRIMTMVVMMVIMIMGGKGIAGITVEVDTNIDTVVRYATITNSVFSNVIITVKDGKVNSEMYGVYKVYVTTNKVLMKNINTNDGGEKWLTYNLREVSKIEEIDIRCSEVTFGRGRSNMVIVTLLNNDVKKVMDMKHRLYVKRGVVK